MDVTQLQQAATEYADQGWYVFPLSVRSKVPRKGWQNWQNRASNDVEEIDDLWERFSGSNIAVQLGEKSGIIDIECDSKAGEDWLVSIFGGAENMPVTPTFISSTKTGTPGKHRLFRFTNELPNSDKGHWRPTTSDGIKQDVDFKVGGGAKGTYSLFPPSIHPDTGETYRWLITPEEADIAELPEEFIARLFDAMYGEGGEPEQGESKTVEHWLDVSEGLSEGDRNNGAASFIGFLLGTLADPFNNKAIAAQWQLIQAWNERNKPPLDQSELKATFESILRRHRETFTGQHAINDMAQRDPQTGEVSKQAWRIVRVLSEPVTWKLFSPLWPELNGDGFIVLSTEQLVSPNKIKAAAAEQAGVGLPGWFIVFWNGTKKEPGQFEMLMASHDTEEAAAEDKRSYVVAELVYDHLQIETEDGDEPDSRGKPIRTEDGDIWFKVNYLLDRLQHSSDPVKIRELSGILKQIGVTDRQFRVNGKTPTRFKVASMDSMESLRNICLFSPDCSAKNPKNSDVALRAIEGATHKGET